MSLPDGFFERSKPVLECSASYHQLATGDMLDYLDRRLGQLNEMLDSFDLRWRQDLVRAAQIVISSFSTGGKLLIAGNGGSAAEAQHMAAELVGRFQHERPAMPAIALTTDTSILTAISNDYDYADVFARQVQALGQPGDVFLGISTSGSSLNLVRAAAAARIVKATSIALVGQFGSPLAEEVDLALCLQSADPATAQEGQLVAIHIMCGLIEAALEAPMTDKAEQLAGAAGGQP